jgi:dihydrofolate reductase
MTVRIVVAVDSRYGFASNGKIPWDIPEDFKHFIDSTRDSYCVMGKNSYEEMREMKKERLGDKYDPTKPILANRKSFVLSTTLCLPVNISDVLISQYYSMQSIISLLKDTRASDIDWLPEPRYHDISILGGYRIFRDAIPFVDEIIMTHIPDDFKCDSIFPFELIEANGFTISSIRTLDTEKYPATSESRVRIITYTK